MQPSRPSGRGKRTNFDDDTGMSTSSTEVSSQVPSSMAKWQPLSAEQLPTLSGKALNSLHMFFMVKLDIDLGTERLKMRECLDGMAGAPQ